VTSTDAEIVSVHAFAKLARDYCALVESEPGQPVDVRAVAKMLAQLIGLGLDLPSDLFEDFSEMEADSSALYGRAKARFSGLPFDLYFDVCSNR